MIRSRTAVETLKDPLTVFLPDLRSIIVNGDKDFAFAIVYRNCNWRPGCRVLSRVIDELHDGGAEQLPVSIRGAESIGDRNFCRMAAQLGRIFRQDLLNQQRNHYSFL